MKAITSNGVEALLFSLPYRGFLLIFSIQGVRKQH